MLNPFVAAEKSVVTLLLKNRQYDRLFRYVDMRLTVLPKLYLLKAAIQAAKSSGDKQRIERYADASILFFPENASGYIEKAKVQVEKNRIHAALITLSRGPDTPGIKKARHWIRSSASQVIANPELLDGPGDKKSQDSDVDSESAGGRGLELLDALEMVYKEARDTGLWDTLQEYSRRVTCALPSLPSGYFFQGKALEALEKWPQVVQVMEALPSQVSRGVDYQLLLAQAYRKIGDDSAALRVLNRAQADHIRNRKILHRISEIFRDDGRLERAYVYLKAAQAVYPQYGTVRRLSFETDFRLFEEGNASLSAVFQFKPGELLRFMSMINRVSPFYPDRRDEFATCRARARKSLWSRKIKDGSALTSLLEFAIGCRWLDDANSLVELGQERRLVPKPHVVEWLRRIEADLGRALSDLLEMAWENEEGDTLKGVSNGLPCAVDFETVKGADVVELFIPTPFFSKPSEEKPTYQTVRTLFRHVSDALLDREDCIVVPRLQLNWRYAVPRTNGRVISYHTHTLNNEERRLHIQESPLSGYCSMDGQGFAGYASIASDFESIRMATGGVDKAALERNREALYREFVGGNKSKYAQTKTEEKIEGPYVFVALQIPTDIVADLAYVSGVELLRTVAKAYQGTGTRVVAKRHPYCGSITVQNTLEELVREGSIMVSKGSIHDLIKGADAVYTVNSGVGLEALLHMKPVVVTGKCDYEYAVTLARDIRQLEDVAKSPVPLNEDRVLEFLYYYRNEFLCPCDDGEVVRRKLTAWLER